MSSMGSDKKSAKKRKRTSDCNDGASKKRKQQEFTDNAFKESMKRPETVCDGEFER
jgi:hypothetical protein